MNEIKFIEGTGNAYGCDQEGNIYSFHIPGGKGKVSKTPVKKLAQWTGTNNDYFMVVFCLDGVKTNQLVHRLVAKTWLPNPNNYPEVDHIDNNVQNNNVNNLRWCSREFNLGRQTNDKGALNGLRSYTELYDKNGTLIGCFNSITSACRYASDNYECSKTGLERNHKSKGYYLKVANSEKRKVAEEKRKSKWDLYSPDNQYINTFSSKREAGRYIKENIRDISVKLFSDSGKAYGYYVIQKGVETK